MVKQAQQPTDQQIQQTTGIMGWLITFDMIIAAILNTITGSTIFNIIGIALCVGDREMLKKYKGIKISFLRCILPPTYLYKRAILLKEPMTKFYISLALYIMAALGIAIIFFAVSQGAMSPADFRYE